MFKEIVANAIEGIVILKKEKITFCNAAFLRLLNLEEKDTSPIGKKFTSYLEAACKKKFFSRLETITVNNSEKAHFNVELITHSDQRIDIEIYLSEIIIENEKVILLSARKSEIFKKLQQTLKETLAKEIELRKTFQGQTEELAANEEELRQSLEHLFEFHEKLDESEIRYKTLIDSSPVGIVVHSDFKMVFINEAGIKLLEGELESDFIGKNIMDFVVFKDQELLKECVKATYNKEDITPIKREQFKTLKNNVIEVEVKGNPISYMGENAVQISFVDVTAKVAIEKSLDSIYDVTLNYKGVALYKKVVAILSEIFQSDFAFVGQLTSKKKATIKTLAFYQDGQFLENFEYDLESTPCEKLVLEGECFYSKDVTPHFPQDIWLAENNIESYIGIAIADIHDNPLGVVVLMHRKKLLLTPLMKKTLGTIARRVASEIEQKNTYKKLQNSKKDYQTLFQKAHEAIVIFESESKIILDVNPKACEMYGYSKSELIGASWKKITVNIDYGKKKIQETLKNGSVKRLITHQYGKNKEILTVEINAEVIQYKGKKVIFSTCKDITEKTIASGILKASKEKYKRLYHKTPVMLHTVNRNFEIINMSNLWLEKLGYSYEEVVGKKGYHFLTEKCKKRVVEKLFPLLKKKKNIENVHIQYCKKDGAVMDVLISAIADFDEDGNFLYSNVISEDITEKIQAERDLKSTIRVSENLQTAMNTASIVAMVSLENDILYVNKQFCEISKYSKEELIGKAHSSLRIGYESKAFIKSLQEDLLKGKTHHQEYQLRAKDGSFYWLDTTIVPFLDLTGTPEYFIEISYDITEKKKTAIDLETNNRELKKTNKELDKFVYSVSHQLRSPLASILGLLNIAKYELGDSNTTQLSYLDLMEKSIKKLDATTHEINDYSWNARMDLTYQTIDLTTLFTHIFENFQSMEEAENMETQIIIEGKEVPFKTDLERLQIVVNSLISNAIKYRNIANLPLQVNVKATITSKKAIISVQDNGIGIHKEQLEKIFDMFYRGATESSGSGLGLYILKETLEKLDGEVTLTSEVYKGSCFTVTIRNYARE